MPLVDLSELDRSSWDVIIRVDVNEQIGSGHAMRCMAIAECIERDGGRVLFAVSDQDSASTLLSAGKECVVMHSDYMRFDSSDGKALGVLGHKVGADAILVDSYAVTDVFFEALNDTTGGKSTIAWIDDLYTYELGEHDAPIARQVDCVISYSLGMSLLEYEDAYASTQTRLCIGPRFAPVRPQFSRFDDREYDEIGRIMVTTGSTNEGQLLEKMVEACLQTIPTAQIDVIVGSLASFASFNDNRVIEHKGVTDLAPYMQESDMCICAAGTTLYELSAIGVPVIAIPIVGNQKPNATGFKRLGLGIVVECNADMGNELMKGIRCLSSNPARRKAFVSKMHQTVDGKGAQRIASNLHQ